MTTMLTVEQILALAPDASAAQAGRGLANQAKWVSLAADEQAVWGECAGSGKNPYQTQIDLQGPAFKCSCPSRKFPCKHALGLYLLLATTPTAFPSTAQPAWVADWLASRAKREEKKATAATESAATQPDPQAQAKRAAQREQKVARGLDDLERWLCDLVRQGLGQLSSQPRNCWETMAARMVDAQASGAARMLRRMARIPASGEGWQERLLEQLGLLSLLIERYKRLETLPEEVQADIRTHIGWTQNQQELLAGEGIGDQWAVLGQRVQREDHRLRVQRTWLYGQTTNRVALLLQFAPGKDAFPAQAVPGMSLDGELVYYPSAWPLRALIKTQQSVSPLGAFSGGSAGITEACKAYAGALVKVPWLEQFPLILRETLPVQRGDKWYLRDAAAQLLPLDATFPYTWELLACSGGHPLTIFGEWDGAALFPIGAMTAERHIPLTAVED